MTRTLTLLVALTLLPSVALAKIPEERLEKLFAKLTVSESEVFTKKAKPRLACVCATGGQGFLVRRDAPPRPIVCAVGVTFVDGLVGSFSPCETGFAIKR